MPRLAFVIAALVAVAACGPSHAPAPPDPAPTGTRIDGTHGAVCAWGERGESAGPRPQPAACQAPLQCCYPCGVGGCSSTCQTDAECREDMTRP